MNFLGTNPESSRLTYVGASRGSDYERLRMKRDMKHKLESVVTVLQSQQVLLKTLVDNQQEYIDQTPDSRDPEDILLADDLLELLEEARDMIEAARETVQACLAPQ